MKNRFVNWIKNNKCIYKIIIWFYRVFYNFLGLFIRQKKQIIFSSFGGRKFDDSTYALYKKIIDDPFFNDYKLIWAFNSPKQFSIPRGKKVKIDSFRFFICLLSSKIWISNTSSDRGIGIKKKRVIRVETWHGTPIKKICGEENTPTFEPKKYKKVDSNTIRCAQSEYDQEIFARIFNASLNSIVISDLPRNDELTNEINITDKNRLLNDLGIPANKKIILYMPTYREYLLDDKFNNYIAPPVHFDYWKRVLGDDYVILFRAHYAINKVLGIKTDDFIKDVSEYPHLNSLYLLSDLLISDYSSAFFDFSITGKPMLCFAYDLEEYKEKRGLYLDIENDLKIDVCKTENELLDKIKKPINKTSIFKEKYVKNPGNASSIIIETIKKRILMSK